MLFRRSGSDLFDTFTNIIRKPESVVTKTQFRFNSPHVSLYQQLTVTAVLLLLVSLSRWQGK
jgi:hypothetical protein